MSLEQVNDKQRPDICAIRTTRIILPSKSKWEITEITKRHVQFEHMVNRIHSSFQNDGYFATLTELGIIRTKKEKVSNDQELMHSEPKSRPRNQYGE